jgi:3-oxoacyl-(acyl-carrier-protein) synthase
VLGEGAAFLVLESLESARQRGAIPLARLAGWSIRSDPSLRAGMDESGTSLAETIRDALRNAGMSPEDIGYLNTHGTGTRLNDLAEARAIHQVFGSTNPGVPCSSTKPVTGHCLGASAAIEAVIGILALQHHCAPPTGACLEHDPECEIRVIRGEGMKFDARAVLSISSGFWGNQAALVFDKTTDFAR